MSAEAPPTLYLDASSVVKLVVAEPESPALRERLSAGGRKASSEVVLTESFRAVRRRAAARGDDGDRERMTLASVIEGLELLSLDRGVLARAGGLPPSMLGTLDAIHLATALSLLSVPVCFVSYDRRQIEAARLAGLSTASPGAESQ